MASKHEKQRQAVIETMRTNLRILRTAKGWTQEEFADRLNVDRVTITRIETGFSVPDFPFVCRMAEELGVEVGIFHKKNLKEI